MAVRPDTEIKGVCNLSNIYNKPTTTLSNLPINKGAYISALNVDDSLRRRLLDLGFSSGNRIIPLYSSPLGDPTAYSVMGSVIALRKETASHIEIVEADDI